MEIGKWHIAPDIEVAQSAGLSETLKGIDQNGKPQEMAVINEKPLTLFLNSTEIVTHMTIGDYPEYLAVGYLFNQHILTDKSQIAEIEYDKDLSVVVVRTHCEPEFTKKQHQKIHTSGCAQGTIFGDIYEIIAQKRITNTTAPIKTSWLYDLQKQINQRPSLYLQAGAVHGCVLCHQNIPLIFMEDVGRHNAIDKIAGYMVMHDIAPHDKIFYTTGRLTSEMVIKTILMDIPILVSRSGFTVWGAELALGAGLTLIGRMRGNRFTVLSGEERLVFDAAPTAESSHSA